MPDWATTLKSQGKASNGKDREERVGFKEGKFEWDVAPRDLDGDDEGQMRFALGPLDVIFPKGQLSLVSGPTGCGKSALLNALLGGALASSLAAVAI